jgi:hypothetical protein
MTDKNTTVAAIREFMAVKIILSGWGRQRKIKGRPVAGVGRRNRGASEDAPRGLAPSWGPVAKRV